MSLPTCFFIEQSASRAPRTAPSPLEGEGWGGGYVARSEIDTPLPTPLRVADLPLKAGGNKKAKHRRLDGLASCLRSMPLSPARGEGKKEPAR